MNAPGLLPAVELEPEVPATAAVIWLHGLGADGHDFVPIVSALGLPARHAVRFVFPHAPSMPVTINGGYVMPAWYDIQAMDLERKVDEVQLRRSAEAVRALVAREQARDIRCERIVIAGFSQGGAVGFELALSHPHALGGLLAMSTYFATRRSVARHPANAALPIAIHHGSADPLVPESLGHDSARQLREWGYPVEYRSYPMEHAVCPAQVRDIGAWLSARFA